MSIPVHGAFSDITSPGGRFLAEAAYVWSVFGEHTRALRIFERLGVAFPAHHLPVLGQAECHIELGAPLVAARLAEAAETLGGHSRQSLAYAVLVKGKAHARLGRAREATRAFDQASQLDPNGLVGNLAKDMAAVLRPASKQRKVGGG